MNVEPMMMSPGRAEPLDSARFSFTIWKLRAGVTF